MLAGLVLLAIACAACGREQGAVPPVLTAIAPNRAVQGQTVNVVLSGANFVVGAAVNVTGSEVAVSHVVVSSSSQITATFAVAPNATLGTDSVTVTSAGMTTGGVPFTVAAPLRVVSTTPSNGATGVPVNATFTASFSAALNCATVTSVSFALTGPGGAAVPGKLSCSGNSAAFTPSPLLASDTTYTATLSTAITDSSADALDSADAVSFTTAPAPAVTATTPVNGATGVPGALPAIAADFSEPLNCASVGAASFAVSGPAGAVPGTVTCSGSGAAFTPTAALAVNTTYAAVLSTAIANAAGAGLAGNYAWSFRTAPTPPTAPTVISTVPANQATGVPINQQVAAAFNEAMTPSSINSASFLLSGPGGAAVAGSVTYVATGSAATFAPAAPLAVLTLYTATITTAVTSVTGTAMASNYTWTFTTGAAPDTTKPTITATIPADAATAVPVNQALTITFSKSMSPATINASTVTVTAAGGAAVSGLVSYSVIAHAATFTPLANLASATVYTAAVTTAAQDLAGNPLGPGAVANPFTFTTAAAPDTTKPTIVSTNPVAGATGVAINGAVNATFSEAMDPLTITTTTFQLTDSSGNVVPGTVAYDPATFIATFTPSANLNSNATYTATISTGAADVAGNSLGAGAVSNPWMFNTVATVAPAVNLGTASLFGGFGGGAGMTNQGTLTTINGDIGTTGASTLMTGFHDSGTGCVYTETPLNVGFVNGSIDTAAPPPTVACPTEGTAQTMAIATQAASDALAAFNATSPALMPPTVAAQASELGGLTLPPGVYQSASGSFSITNGDLTLDAQGNANAVWVFQSASSLTVGIAGPSGARNIILINGAQAKNVYWHVGSAATINAAGGGTMVGTILAQSGISFSTAGNVALTTLDGRALTLTGPVTMVDTVINVPQP